MNPGEMRHRIQIKEVVETRDDTGELIRTWTTIATAWASVKPIAGRELLQADQAIAESTVRIRMRYIRGVTTECNIIHRGRTLEINRLINVDDIDKEYEILCSEAV